MFKRFKSKDITFMAIATAILFVLSFFIATAINAATGVPASAGLVMLFFASLLISIYISVLRKAGVVTIIMILHTTLSIPTMIFGPPGIYKVAVGIIYAIIIELFIFIGGYKQLPYYLGLSIAAATVPITEFLFMVLLGLPNAQNLAPLLGPLTAIFFVEGLVGTWVGIYIYRKLKDKKIIKQFSH